jgi:phenylacetic acid degradation protein paaN
MHAAAIADPEPGTDWFERHRERFEAAQDACRTRACWSPFPELPARYPDAEAAQARGRAAFDTRLGRPFAFDPPLPGAHDGAAPARHEVSPYTREPLGIAYPMPALDPLFDAATRAIARWADADPEQRIGVLMEVVDRLYRDHLFELAHAVMHTAGQSFNMAYAGSGVNALDRAIEALVHAHAAMAAVPHEAHWSRAFGRETIALRKTYRLVPRGVAVCFACASFPTWNAWPSMMASLATGNAVIVKPHPATVLPMAISVQVFRRVLADAGFDPDLVTMALDTPEAPIGKAIVKHPACAIVDFTGSTRFGRWVEANAHPALAYTETAGCNTVVLHSFVDEAAFDAALRSLATTACMFSAQMCTSPQNFYVAQDGVRVGAARVSCEAVGERLAGAIAELTREPRRAGMILAAIQSEATLALVREMEAEARVHGRVLLAPAAYTHPDYAQARTCTPLVAAVDTGQRALYGEERFGPVVFVIRCADPLAEATADVREFGGLTAFVYADDEAVVARAEAQYARAGAQLTINLTGAMPLNFAAAYSDYHVTGLNPAGNASLTDLAFVALRFRIAQSRRPEHGHE